ncbi:MAG: hypothetical protein ACKPJD_02540, partial [Planctomycetaceae bacterium]
MGTLPAVHQREAERAGLQWFRERRRVWQPEQQQDRQVRAAQQALRVQQVLQVQRVQPGRLAVRVQPVYRRNAVLCGFQRQA